ncbi:MAG: RNA polymerase factor sigma-32 [Alphaproteobacteria bacterium]
MAHLDDDATQRANLTFIRRAMSAPILSRDNEQDLARRWRDRGDERALHDLINAYERLVVSIATKFRNYGLPLGDLIQEGNIGLLQAANRFDPDREVRFSTYAAWWIRAAVQDFVLRNWSIVRTGTTAAQKSLFFNLRRLRARIEGDNGATMTDAGRHRVATELRVPVGEVEAMEMRISGHDQSLNAPVGQEGETEMQHLLADNRPSPEDVVIGLRDAESRSRWLNAALTQLSERERRIIRERRLTERGVTLEHLGNALGVSKERVRQLENRALCKLRNALEQHAADPRDLLFEVPA